MGRWGGGGGLGGWRELRNLPMLHWEISGVAGRDEFTLVVSEAKSKEKNGVQDPMPESTWTTS